MYLHCEKLPYTIKTNIKTIKTQTLKKKNIPIIYNTFTTLSS